MKRSLQFSCSVVFNSLWPHGLQWNQRSNVPLVSLFFLKRSLVFSILLFCTISLHWSLKNAFLSLLAVIWDSAFKWVYLSFLPLPLGLFFFSAICKASSDNCFASFHFFSLGMVLITASCTMSWTSVHCSSGSLPDLIPWIYLSLSLYNGKGLDLGHTWMLIAAMKLKDTYPLEGKLWST